MNTSLSSLLPPRFPTARFLVLLFLGSLPALPANLVKLEFTQYRVSEGSKSVTLAVCREVEQAGNTVVNYSTEAATAIPGQDYVETAGSVQFTGQDRTKLITVSIINDGAPEGTETARVRLTGAVGGELDPQTSVATITIEDNDAGIQIAPVVPWATTMTLWADETVGDFEVTVLRGNDVDLAPFSVKYATANGTAVAGTDYSAVAGTLSFAAGETTKTISIPIFNDGKLEPKESFSLSLSNPSGTHSLRSGKATATISILDMTGMEPHGFGTIQCSSGGLVRFGLSGGVADLFRPFFDQYLLEASSDLTHWEYQGIVGCQNASAGPLEFVDSGGVDLPMRFYRTPREYFIVPYPPLSGLHPVGITTRTLTDPSRRNRYLVSDNSSFVASIWYPATPEVGARPRKLLDELIARDPVFHGGMAVPLAYFHGRAFDRATCDRSRAPYPVVLHSPCYPSFREGNNEWLENLASHDYVAISIDHFDAQTVVFPEGGYTRVPSWPSLTAAGLQDRVVDLSFVLDVLEQWNDADPDFAGCFDLSRVAVMGFSWGGETAAEFCRVDDRCQAAILLEPGGTSGPVRQLGLFKPFLQANASGNLDKVLFQKAAQDAFWFQLSGTVHDHFWGASWWLFPNDGDVDVTLRTYTLSFLNRYLKGSNDTLHEGPSANHPRVINHSAKM